MKFVSLIFDMDKIYLNFLFHQYNMQLLCGNTFKPIPLHNTVEKP